MADCCPWLESIGTCGDGKRCAIDLTPMLSSSVFSSSLIHYFSQQILNNGNDQDNKKKVEGDEEEEDEDGGHKKRRKQSPATSIDTNINTAIPPFAAIVFSDALGHSENLSRLLAASFNLSSSLLRIGKIDVMEEMENNNNNNDDDDDDDAHSQLLPTVQSWLASNPIDRRVLLVQDWISCPGERPHEM